MTRHKDTLPVLPVEDVTVGIWVETEVLSGLAVSIQHDSRFHYDANSQFGGVPCLDGDLVLHHVSPVIQVCLAQQPHLIDCSCWEKSSSAYRTAADALKSTVTPVES